MTKFLGLTKRNLLVFWKDRLSIAFSLLTSAIVLVLYLLFLKGTFVDAINSVLESAVDLKYLIRAEDVETFSNLLLFSGILGSAMITVSFQCLTVIVRDRENKVDYDISVTPIRRWQIILSYFTAAAISSIIMTGLILTIGLIILRCMGNIYMDAEAVLSAYGVLVLGSISATAFFMVVVLFFRSTSASGAFFGILSVASGFVIGAYIPISQFSDKVQTICNIFPASHVTILLRNVLLNGVLEEMDSSIGGLDNGLFTDSLREVFTFEAHMAGYNLNVDAMTVYIIVVLCICLAAMVFAYGKTYKR